MLGQPLHERWLIFFPILLISLFFPLTSSAAERVPTLSIDKTTVPWKHLSFKGKEFFAKLVAEVELTSPSKSELDTAFIPSPQGVPIAITKSGALIIDTKISVKSVFAKVKLQNIAWFDPVTLSTMQYVRQRIGLKDAKKIYRFTDKGVFRFTKQPIDKNEIIQLPEKWSAVKERFYPYDPEKEDCVNITAPMPVIYLISASKASDFEKPVTICVFNKKETIYLDIQKEPAESVQLDHIEIKGDEAIQRNTSILAEVLTLKARSISSGQPMNNFTLVGLQGNIKIYIDPESRVPVQLRGDYQGLGEIKLKLRQMVHK
jgi:hypothetical protein